MDVFAHKCYALLTHCSYLQVSSPMDLSTMLMRVDQRRYPTLAAYMADLRSIATATQQYWAGEARGAREVHWQPCSSWIHCITTIA